MTHNKEISKKAVFSVGFGIIVSGIVTTLDYQLIGDFAFSIGEGIGAGFLLAAPILYSISCLVDWCRK